MSSLRGTPPTAPPVDAADRFAAGTIVLGSSCDVPTDGDRDGHSGRRPVCDLLGVPDDPWSLSGVVVSGCVTSDASHVAALDAALRGADVVVEVDTGLLPSFLDDVRRLQITLWSPSPTDTTQVDAATGGSSADWAPLLDALAAGDSVEQAARRCHISVRSAHRRLARARAALGVPSTATAVALWAAG